MSAALIAAIVRRAKSRAIDGFRCLASAELPWLLPITCHFVLTRDAALSRLSKALSRTFIGSGLDLKR